MINFKSTDKSNFATDLLCHLRKSKVLKLWFYDWCQHLIWFLSPCTKICSQNNTKISKLYLNDTKFKNIEYKKFFKVHCKGSIINSMGRNCLLNK